MGVGRAQIYLGVVSRENFLTVKSREVHGVGMVERGNQDILVSSLGVDRDQVSVRQ